MTGTWSGLTREDVDAADLYDLPDRATGRAEVIESTAEHRLLIEPCTIGNRPGWAWFIEEWIAYDQYVRGGADELIENPDYPGGFWTPTTMGVASDHVGAFEAGEDELSARADERATDRAAQGR